MIPVTLRSEDLHAGMLERPDIPFFVSTRDYSIVDGDTIRIRTAPDAEGIRHEAFRIRLNAINTPELIKKAMFDRVLDIFGPDEKRYGPGEQARDKLREICSGKMILVDPVMEDDKPVTDRYGRLLATICVSGSKGKQFDLVGAYSIEAAMVLHGLAQPIQGKSAPALKPRLLESIEQYLDQSASPQSTGFM